MGIDRDLFTPIFALARVSGWLSQWLEQLSDNRIFRPSQIFTGASRKNKHPNPDKKRPGIGATIIRRAHLDDATIEGMALVGGAGQRGGRGDLGRRPGAMAR